MPFFEFVSFLADVSVIVAGLLIPIMIGSFGAWIGYQQHLVSKRRLDFEMHETRVGIYGPLMEMANSAIFNRPVPDDLQLMRQQVNLAPFFFSDDSAKLMIEVSQKSDTLINFRRVVKNTFAKQSQKESIDFQNKIERDVDELRALTTRLYSQLIPEMVV